jgi:hypothetical protein
MKVRICHNCGKYNQPDAWTCIMCGTDIRANGAQEVADASGERYDPNRAAMTKNANAQVPAAPTPVYAPAAGSGVVVNNGVITDIQIPFGRLVVLILQFYLASIPAMIIIMILAGLLFGCLSAIGLISIGNMFR